MKTNTNKNGNPKFDTNIFNMSAIEFEIVGLFEQHVLNDEISLLWEKISNIVKGDKYVTIIVDLYKEGKIPMIECESLILLFVRHNQLVWNELNDELKESTKFRSPVELINNILNTKCDQLKLNVSELKFITKIMRIKSDITYNKFFETSFSTFKNLLLIKTFFMKRSILESYTSEEYTENIHHLKTKTVKDLICHFLVKKLNN
ncbi:hypothetical protein [Spiroplasma endosymbiont of Othius punctulatus]|uniref:hypothetical protein n=1 Tax=Spiroplasma endosymbiont of Othius punctulatus TaxID=3066289 RepID=UPI0030D42E49